MTNHPNRSKRFGHSATPTPDEVRALRESAGLTVVQAASLLHTTKRTWENWEAKVGSKNHRRMHPAFWELVLQKIGGTHS